MLGRVLFLVVLLLGLPLLGAFLAGHPIATYVEFPPRTRYVEHAPFSWLAFLAITVTLLATILPFLQRFLRAGAVAAARPGRWGHFPRWGWMGLFLLGGTWVLAWTRFDWFAAWQSLTFPPLWLGYIVTMNALTCSRRASCLLLRRPAFLLGLFPLSAAFWWFFEYLNRFVQNWYYVGVHTFTPVQYTVHATLSFATVLPAVLSTTEWLATFPRLQAAARAFPPVQVRHPMAVGMALLLIASAGLMGIGVRPDYLFSLLWVSPLVVITGAQMAFGQSSWLARLADGDWRPVWLPALAGLHCGVFWEMWNVYSLAKWQYEVPFVHRFLIFEMPLLGYGGYLPFGIECYVVATLLDRHRVIADEVLSG